MATILVFNLFKNIFQYGDLEDDMDTEKYAQEELVPQRVVDLYPNMTHTLLVQRVKTWHKENKGIPR